MVLLGEDKTIIMWTDRDGETPVGRATHCNFTKSNPGRAKSQDVWVFSGHTFSHARTYAGCISNHMEDTPKESEHHRNQIDGVG